MKLLLDTHIMIWALTDDPRLSQSARNLLSSPENIILFSMASLWEIAIKNQKAPEKCPYHENEILQYCTQAGYLPLEIKSSHVLCLRELKTKPDHYLSNYDPFDRMIISQAKAENCTVLSHDTAFQNYDEPCILMV